MVTKHSSAGGFKSGFAAENVASASASVSENFEVVRLDEQSSVVRVDGAELPFRLDAGSGPRVHDLEFARWLGYEKPHDIRELIGRMKGRGRLPGVVFRTVRKTEGGRPGREFWLSRSEALLIATRSETKKAEQMTDLIIEVFGAVLDGRMARPSNDPILRVCVAQLAEMNRSLAQVTTTLANLSTALVANTTRIEALELRSTASTQGRIAAVDCGRLLQAFRDIANLITGGYTKGDKEQSRRWSKARLLADHKTRAAARHPMGRAWHTLDPRDLNAAWQRIDELREEARAAAAKREIERLREATLFS